jgi:ribosome maturation factor RimP
MDVRNEVVEMATPLADELGFEVVDVEYVQSNGRWLVRVYLDRPGGIKLEDCARFSRRLGDLLEMNQTLPHAYTIEVSSPGIERRLRAEEHFRRHIGQRAKVEVHEQVDGRRRAVGVIEGVGDNAVTLLLDSQESWTVPLADVRQARLVVDPWPGSKDRENTSRSAKRRGKGGRVRHGG